MKAADRGIVIAIIVAVIIIVIAILIILFYSYRSSQVDLQDQEPIVYPSYIAPIWGNNRLVGVCTGYRFPPINSTTPAIVHNTVDIEGGQAFNGGFNCTWNDELNRQLIERTCLQGICIDDQGNSYQVGETSLFSSSCGGTIRCVGDLGLISIGRGANSYGCLSIEGEVSTCDLFQYDQYMIFNYINDYLVQISSRDSDYSLTVSDGRVTSMPTLLLSNGGIQWIAIPPMIIRTSGSARIMEAPPQIGYVGHLPDSIINDSNHYKTMDTLRDFIIGSSIMTLRWVNGRAELAPWRLVLPGTDSVYDPQASAYVGINNMDQIPAILSQP